MQQDDRIFLRRVVSGSLIVIGLLAGLLGTMFLLAGFMAIDPEDEVPFAMWFVPLILGVLAVAAGIRLSPRSIHEPPPGGR